jgi:hypothetical protein
MNVYLKRLPAYGLYPVITFFLALTLALVAMSAFANDNARPKEVSLIINGKRLVASNIRFSRFDTLNLNAQEKIRERAEAKGVILIVTNQRIIGYGVSGGWRDLKTEAGEKLESFTVEDYAAFVITNKRYLNFNGETGQWGKQDRRTKH